MTETIAETLKRVLGYEPAGIVTLQEAERIIRAYDALEPFLPDIEHPDVEHHPARAGYQELGDALRDAWRIKRDLDEEPPPNSEPEPEPEPIVETAPFREGGAYEHLDDEAVNDEANAGRSIEHIDYEGGYAPFINSFGSSAGIKSFLHDMAGRAFVGSSDPTSWRNPHGEHDHGPLGLIRWYDFGGVLRNFTAARVGDFHKGREGHVAYINLLGSLTMENVAGVQCGAQLLQADFRPWETIVPESEWRHYLHSITSRNCSAIDMGAINEGQAVRASWPLSIFHAGQRAILVEDYTVRCDHPDFFNRNGGPWGSHGAALIRRGSVPRRRFKDLRILNIDVDVRDPDREIIYVASGMSCLIDGGKIRVRGEARRNWISFSADLDSFTITSDVDWDGQIRVMDPTRPYRALETVDHTAGTTYEWVSST